jgi:hypothetical protein
MCTGVEMFEIKRMMIRIGGYRLSILGATAFLAFPWPHAFGDGLIYQLPSDGSWVRYKLSEEGTAVITFPPGDPAPPGPGGSTPSRAKIRGSLELRSVGKVDMDGEACRWIELKLEAEIVGTMPATRRS